MSRIGKLPITIPSGTEVTISDGFIIVKGKGGELRKKAHNGVQIAIDGDTATVTPANDSRESQALWGTYASHLQNMIAGVNEPFEKKLIVEGVGFKVNLNGSTLVLDVGFSHSIELVVPEGLDVSVEKNEITIKGANKELVGQFAADVRASKKPEPYKGKGIRYHDEVIRRKEGKRATA